MKKTLAIILTIIMALGMTGCGVSKEQKAFAGTWEAKIDFLDHAGDEDVKADFTEYLGVDDWTLIYTLEVKADGTCSAKIEEADVEVLEDRIRNDAPEILKNAILVDFEQEFTSDDDEDVTLEEVLDYFGYENIDEMIEDILGEPLEDMITETIDEAVDAIREDADLTISEFSFDNGSYVFDGDRFMITVDGEDYQSGRIDVAADKVFFDYQLSEEEWTEIVFTRK